MCYENKIRDMINVKRFGVSLEEEFQLQLDGLVKQQGFPNRSQAIRFLVRKYAVEDAWQNDSEVAGAIVLVYDHHKRDLLTKSTEVQHDFHHLILSVQHVHLDHHNCLETIAVKGYSFELKTLSNQLFAIKGIKHGELVMTSIN